MEDKRISVIDLSEKTLPVIENLVSKLNRNIEMPTDTIELKNLSESLVNVSIALKNIKGALM